VSILMSRRGKVTEQISLRGWWSFTPLQADMHMANSTHHERNHSTLAPAKADAVTKLTSQKTGNILCTRDIGDGVPLEPHFADDSYRVLTHHR
jgi:hypothetical protein